MDKSERNSFLQRNKVFLSLLFVGLFLRICFIEFQGLSNDELSAWYRTRFPMGEEFWSLGVSRGDMHPAFYQVFLWIWVRLFGDAEFSLRATSLLFFTANLVLIYQIGCRFFTKHTANLIVAFYVSLGFLIVNTTTARPYNSGVFFLLLAFYLVLLLKEKKELFGWGRTLLLLVAFFGAMTSHYFAFLSVGLLGVCSLFYVEKKQLKYLVISGGTALLLFVFLHLSITIEQLSQGGLGWLGKPDFFWFVDFSKQLFQNSILTLVIGAGLIIFAKRGNTRPNSAQGFSLIVLVVISTVAYLISIFYTPILRELVFQYILPFAFFGIIGPLYYDKKATSFAKLKPILPFVIVLLFSLHSVLSYQLFEPVHYGVFRELAQNQKEIEREYGEDNITYAQNTNNFGYLNYYLKKPNMSESISDWSSPETLYTLAERARNAESKYFLYNWSNNYHVDMYREVIRYYYPTTVKSKDYFNSGFGFYAKDSMGQESNVRLLKNLTGEGIFKGDEYFLNVSISIKEMKSLLKEGEYFLLKADGQVYNAKTFFLVVEARDENDVTIMNGEEFFWFRADDQQRLIPTNNTKTFFTAFTLDERLNDTDQVRIYGWNPEKDTILFNNLKLYAVK